MKAITVSMVALVVMIAGLYFYNSTEVVTRYVKSEVEVIKEVTPEWAQDEDAVKAAQAVIRKKELESELTSLDAQIKELQTRRKSVTDELTAYWSDESHIKQLIRETFPEDPVTAVAVAMAESRLKPYALNAADSHKGCSGSYGIFQIGCLHETDPSTLYDVEYNIKRAKEIYDESKWQPWGAYTNGSYLAYMP